MCRKQSDRRRAGTDTLNPFQQSSSSTTLALATKGISSCWTTTETCFLTHRAAAHPSCWHWPRCKHARTHARTHTRDHCLVLRTGRQHGLQHAAQESPQRPHGQERELLQGKRTWLRFRSEAVITSCLARVHFWERLAYFIWRPRESEKQKQNLRSKQTPNRGQQTDWQISKSDFDQQNPGIWSLN